jgi:hypothetical protein
MNDNALLTAVREQRNKVPMTVPLQQVVNRGRAVRARRRIRRLAAVLAAAAVAAVAVTVLPPASHPAGRRPGTQLAAWAVVEEPDGTIAVTIHKLFNPAGLQGKLRADGVPARVTFYGGRRYPSPCRAYPAGRAFVAQVFPPDPGAPAAAITIRPSALPPGAGVYINDSSNPYGYIGIQTGLVRASKRCTGS